MLLQGTCSFERVFTCVFPLSWRGTAKNSRARSPGRTRKRNRYKSYSSPLGLTPHVLPQRTRQWPLTACRSPLAALPLLYPWHSASFRAPWLLRLTHWHPARQSFCTITTKCPLQSLHALLGSALAPDLHQSVSSRPFQTFLEKS
jgi:hypothetical protein